MNISEITKLITAFRAETEAGAVTPDSVGTLLQKITDALSDVKSELNAIVGKDATDAIDNFREVLSFLAGITDDETLQGKLVELHTKIDSLESAVDDTVTGVELSTATDTDSVGLTVTSTTENGQKKSSRQLPLASAEAAGIIDASTFRKITDTATLAASTAQSLKSSAILQFEGYIDATVDYEPTDADIDKVWYCYEDEKFIRWSEAGWTLAPMSYYRRDGSMLISDTAIFRCQSSLYRCHDGVSLVEFLTAADIEAFGGYINNLASDMAALSASSILPFDMVSPGIPIYENSDIIYVKPYHRFYRYDERSKAWIYEFDYNDPEQQYAYPANRLFICKGSLYRSSSDGLDPILSASTAAESLPKVSASQSGILSAKDYERFDLAANRLPQLNISLLAERLNSVFPTSVSPDWSIRLKMRVSKGMLLPSDTVILFRHGRRSVSQRWINPDPDAAELEFEIKYCYYSHGWSPRISSGDLNKEDGYESLKITATLPVHSPFECVPLKDSLPLYHLGAAYIERNDGVHVKCSDANLLDFLTRSEMKWIDYPSVTPVLANAASEVYLAMRSLSGWKKHKINKNYRHVTYGIGILRDGVLISNIAPFRLALGRRDLIEFTGDKIADIYSALSVST